MAEPRTVGEWLAMDYSSGSDGELDSKDWNTAREHREENLINVARDSERYHQQVYSDQHERLHIDPKHFNVVNLKQVYIAYTVTYN